MITLWPFHRREPRVPPEADEAIQQARRASADADRLSCRVEEVADQLAETGARNHFGAAIERSRHLRRA